MNKKLYLIRREDFFQAIAEKQLPPDCLFQSGQIWLSVLLTEEEKNKYKYPIELV